MLDWLKRVLGIDSPAPATTSPLPPPATAACA